MRLNAEKFVDEILRDRARFGEVFFPDARSLLVEAVEKGISQEGLGLMVKGGVMRMIGRRSA